ncbi:MAG: porin [Pseudomonadales bacterium]|nr:porin [Pseudomonadales bacterium]
MKKNLIPLILSGLTLVSAYTATAYADNSTQLYGKAVLSLQNHEKDAAGSMESAWKLESHASRLGIKGNVQLEEQLKIVYKVEYEIFLDDGKGNNSEFKQRNTFIGLNGDWGTLFAGVHDTPLKIAQGKIDYFSDITDMKLVIDGENRMSNSVHYSSPTFADAFSVKIMTVLGEDNTPSNNDDSLTDHISASINYKTKQFAATVAIDDDIKGQDILRLVAQYKMGKFTLGGLYQESESVATGNSLEGIVVSGSAKLDNGYTAKVQLSQSDQKVLGGQLLSLGVDKKLGRKTKLFAYFTAMDADASTDEQTFFGFGIQHKFSSAL